MTKLEENASKGEKRSSNSSVSSPAGSQNEGLENKHSSYKGQKRQTTNQSDTNFDNAILIHKHIDSRNVTTSPVEETTKDEENESDAKPSSAKIANKLFLQPSNASIALISERTKTPVKKALHEGEEESISHFDVNKQQREIKLYKKKLQTRRRPVERKD